MSKPHPKTDDVVLYVCGDFSHPALVLAARFGETTHLGGDGEPLLDLAFLAPERESLTTRFANPSKPELGYKSGYRPAIVTEYDVVHASHEFSPEAKKKLGLRQDATLAQIKTARGQGEWKWPDEPDGNVAEPVPPAPEPTSEPSKPAKGWGKKLN